VRFVDFLRTTVLVCAGAASVLAAVSVAGAAARDDTGLLAFCAVWWTGAAAVGGWLGRRRRTLPAIADLLAGSRSTTTLPEQRPGTVVLNRLWPLLVALVGAGAVAFLVPQVPAVAAGFAVIWALYWRRQDAAVAAIEERDGIAFYVERTSPLRPMRLVRTPGFRRASA
jgi:hypothetical protein